MEFILISGMINFLCIFACSWWKKMGVLLFQLKRLLTLGTIKLGYFRLIGGSSLSQRSSLYWNLILKLLLHAKINSENFQSRVVVPLNATPQGRSSLVCIQLGFPCITSRLPRRMGAPTPNLPYWAWIPISSDWCGLFCLNFCLESWHVEFPLAFTWPIHLDWRNRCLLPSHDDFNLA